MFLCQETNLTQSSIQNGTGMALHVMGTVTDTCMGTARGRPYLGEHKSIAGDMFGFLHYKAREKLIRTR